MTLTYGTGWLLFAKDSGEEGFQYEMDRMATTIESDYKQFIEYFGSSND